MLNQVMLQALRRSPVWAIDDPARLDAALRAESSGARKAVAMMGPPVNGVQIIPVEGVLTPKPTWIGEWFGGEMPMDHLRAMLAAAVGNPEVRSILLVMDSPGGDVAGVPEMAGEIMAARAIKPVAAHVRYLAASGAYWLASQAETITVEPSGEAGSIGVFAVHASYARALEEEGVEVTVIREPEAKAEWNPWEPLTDAAKEHAAAQVKATYDQFIGAVAAGRGVQASDVRDGFGQGRTLMAADAVKAGMVDRIATLDQAIGRAAKARRSAEDTSRAQRDRDWLTV